MLAGRLQNRHFYMWFPLYIIIFSNSIMLSVHINTCSTHEIFSKLCHLVFYYSCLSLVSRIGASNDDIADHRVSCTNFWRVDLLKTEETQNNRYNLLYVGCKMPTICTHKMSIPLQKLSPLNNVHTENKICGPCSLLDLIVHKS